MKAHVKRMANGLRQRLVVWMSMLLLLSGVLVAPPIGLVEVQAAPPSVNIGDYIQFGKYNDAPILWRVIYKDPTTGNPILLSDRILTIKAYDAKGNYHTGNSSRVSATDFDNNTTSSAAVSVTTAP